MHAHLQSAIATFKEKRVLVIGDVMLDRFIYGAVDRISPEAPVPVLRVLDRQSMLGGAGNVVRNLLALGCKVSFATVIGNDAVGHEVSRHLAKMDDALVGLVTEPGRATTEKTRYVSGSHQIMRADIESGEPISAESCGQLLGFVFDEIKLCDAVILSDYGKGALRDELPARIIAAAVSAKKPVLVDPKRNNFSVYANATIIKPNLAELRTAAFKTNKPVTTEDDIAFAAWQLREAHHIDSILVTRGKEGMTLVRGEDECWHIHASAREVYDVSGAGDTVIATLALGICAGLRADEAARLSNVAAGVVVGRTGTATVSAQDLYFALATGGTAPGNIVSLAEAAARSAHWQMNGERVAFTNGCFDLLHAGHLELLRQSKALADRLIVGINTDRSVRALKGSARPVISEIERAQLLGSLALVDMVVIYDEDTPLETIKAIRPNILTKGGDYEGREIVGGTFVETIGGQVHIVPRSSGQSTTSIFNAISLEKLQEGLPTG
jgi:D-beta-D-heptose 7-phosphate kinase/D-beta-D-heptose 1-phosphate adenosyltransferase